MELDMKKIIGYLKNLETVCFAKNTQGELREVFPGDPVFSGELIVDTNGNYIPSALRHVQENEILAENQDQIDTPSEKESNNTDKTEGRETARSTTSTDNIAHSINEEIKLDIKLDDNYVFIQNSGLLREESGAEININAPVREHALDDATKSNTLLNPDVGIPSAINLYASLSASSDTGVSDTDYITRTNRPFLLGQTLAGATIIVKLPDGTVIASATADTTGSFQVIPSTPIPDGTYTLTFTASLPDGRSKSITKDITIDTTPPAIDVDDITITNDTTPEITGTIDDPDAFISVTINGIEYVATNHADGTWSLADNEIAALSEGAITISVKAIDIAGNESTGSGTIFVDTTIPILHNQNFDYAENQGVNSIVATVTTSDNVSVIDYTFTSTGTQTSADGYFTIDNSGNIKITEAGILSAANDFETNPNSSLYNISVTDTAGNTTTAAITLNETNVNDNTPVAADDIINTIEDTAFTSSIDLITNDTDLDGDNLSVLAGTFATTQGGTLVLAENGSYTYNPAANFNGVDSVAYTVTDGNLTDMGTLTINVGAVNDAAVVSSANVTLSETDVALSTGGTLTATDVDNPDNSFVAQTNIAGTYGTFSLSSDGTWTYLANEAFDALNIGDAVTETFTVSSIDGTPSSVTVTINGTNDAAVITAGTNIERIENNLESYSGYGPIWEGDIYSIISQSEMLAHLNISDPDNINFTVMLADASVEWHGGLQSNNSTFISSSGALQSATTIGDETVIQVTQEFLDNYPQVTANIGDFYFDHVDFDKLAKGDTATIAFDVLVSDADGENSNVTRMSVTVTGSNDQPLAIDHMDTYNEDLIVTSNTSGISNLLDGATDLDTGDILSIAKVNGSNTNVGQAVLVTLNFIDKDGNAATQDIKVTINTDGSYFITQTDLNAIPEGVTATGTINYTVSDNNLSNLDASDESTYADEKQLTIQITGNNDVPIAVVDGQTAIELNTTSQFDALTYDSRGTNPELLGGATSLAIGVTVSSTSSTARSILSYASEDNSNYGNEVLIFSNNTGTSIDIFINGERKAFNLGTSIYDGTPHTLSLNWDSVSGETTLFVDSIDRGTQIIAQGHIIGSNGVFTLGQEQDSVGGGWASNQIFAGTYHDLTIATNGSTVAHWTMNEIDNGLVSDTIGGYDLTAIGQTHIVQNDPNLIGSEDNTLTINVATLLANDTDIDGGTLTISSVQDTQHGTVSLDTNTGTISFTPDADYHGSASFTYTIDDGHGGSDTQEVFLYINAVNDIPDAQDDSYQSMQGSIAVNTTGNDGALVFDSRGSNTELLGGANRVDLSMTLSGSIGSNSLFSYASTSNNNDFLLYTNNEGTILSIYIDGSHREISLNQSLYDGKIHQLDVNWDSSTGDISVTVDGVLNGTSNLQQGYTLATDGVLMLGQEQDTVGGGLDSTQIFRGEYHDLSIAVNGSTVAHWNMEAINNGIVSDTVGNFNLDVTGDVTSISHTAELVTNEDTTLIIDPATLLNNDSDLDGDTLTITSVSNSSHGTVVLNSDSTITFTPDTNYFGEATFEYVISDGNGATDTATVTININAVNDLPTIDNVTVEQLPNNKEMNFWYDIDTNPGTDKSGNGHTTSLVSGTNILTTNNDVTINTGSYDQKVISVSFTTNNVDETDPFQVIYEQGGGWNGYNISVKGDHLYTSVWGESYDTINPDYAIIDLGPIQPNTDYNVLMIHDATASSGGTLTTYLNGVQNPDIKSGVGQMGSHSGSVGIGGYANGTIDPTNPTANLSGNGGEFQGNIHELASWNTADTTVVSEILSYFNDTYATEIDISATNSGIVNLFNVDTNDIEDGGNITYSLINDYNGLFSVDVNGIVSVNADNTFLQRSYDLSVIATDTQAGSVQQNLTVNVNHAGSEVTLTMNGNLDDSAESGEIADTGIIHGNAATEGGVLVLNGSGDYIDFANSADINNGVHTERSVSLWVKTEDGTGTQYLFAEGGGTRSLQIYTDDGILMAKGFNDPVNENNWDNATPTILDTNINIADGEWHQVTITLAGDPNDPLHGLSPDGFKIYLDGTEQDSGIGGAIYGHNNAHVGSDYHGNNTFSGTIDDVQIFNQELSAADVANIAANANIGDAHDNDLIYSTATLIHEGGTGSDNLFVIDSDNIDLSNVGNISNIETISLGTGAGFTGTLSLSDITTITDSNDNLIINGNSSNAITIDSSLTNTGTIIDGYAIYQGASDPTVQLKVDEDIPVTVA